MLTRKGITRRNLSRNTHQSLYKGSHTIHCHRLRRTMPKHAIQTLKQQHKLRPFILVQRHTQQRIINRFIVLAHIHLNGSATSRQHLECGVDAEQFTRQRQRLRFRFQFLRNHRNQVKHQLDVDEMGKLGHALQCRLQQTRRYWQFQYVEKHAKHSLNNHFLAHILLLLVHTSFALLILFFKFLFHFLFPFTFDRFLWIFLAFLSWWFQILQP
mmetsp:Transcript_18244/g.28887  ORF Transcript_18244/g.28887 Transcript_18244/m.28887 type:complete len:213 (+) Transcript_18244:682-1320(+)